MKIINTFLTVLLITLLSCSSWGMPLYELIERNGLYYPRFSDVPFTGEVTGGHQGSLKNGNAEGAWFSYHDDGQLRSKGNFKNGEEDGVWVVYWDNGQLRSKGNYKNGKKEGVWVGWNKIGQSSKKDNYKNGVNITD